jgi:phage terminase large subunit-like protein
MHPNPNPNPTTRLIANSYSKRADEYARRVVAGQIISSRWTKAACQRHLNDRVADSRWDFDTELADKVCRFAETLPHEKGQWASRGELIRLEDFQCFVICSIFGWVDKRTGLRRFREAFLLIPRKNGKSVLAAVIALWMLLFDKEAGAECYLGASSLKQAKEVWKPAKHFVTTNPDLVNATGVKAAAQSIFVSKTGASLQMVIAKPGDGASPHCWVADEFHEHRTPDQTDTAITGMGARTQPLLLMISTAGNSTEGPCRVKQTECERVLSGVEQNDRLFALIYMADPELDWTSEDALISANPNMGVSVIGEFLREEQATAVRNAYAQSKFRTKHLNQWQSSKAAWLNAVDIEAAVDPKLSEDDFLDDPCWIGIDFAAKVDLAAVARTYRREVDGRQHYFVFCSAYLPSARVHDPATKHYAAWELEGWLTATDGSVTEYARIESDVIESIRSRNVIELCFDQWDATSSVQKIVTDTGVTSVEIPTRPLLHLSNAAKELEVLLVDRRIHFSDDPVLRWCLGNLTAKTYGQDIALGKESIDKKIDCAMALLNTLARASVPAAAPTAFEMFWV